MAIHEQSRENLLRDATQFPRRAVFAVAAVKTEPSPASQKIDEIFVGIRKDGAWSFYWDQDYVLQFTSDGELRRVFWCGRKLAARAGRLQELTKLAIGGRVQHERKFLIESEQQQVLSKIRDLLERFIAGMQTGELRKVDQQPNMNQDPALRADCHRLVQRASDCLQIARSPRA